MSWIQRGFAAWRRWPLWGKVATVVVLGALLLAPFIGDSDGDNSDAPTQAVDASTSSTNESESTTTTSSEPPTSTTTTPSTTTTADSSTLPLASSTTAPASSTNPTTSGIGIEVATVTNVVDGDTIDVTIEGQGSDTVRLIGINSPEGGECFSAEATAALATLVADTIIEMTSDQSDRDQYDRLLRYLWLPDGRFINEELVRGGYAIARYRFPSGFTLEQGAEVRVFTGCGTDTAAGLFWCSGSAVWNNDGDTAFLLDASGNIIDSRSY